MSNETVAALLQLQQVAALLQLQLTRTLTRSCTQLYFIHS
jgi:hypothetical protein